MATPSPDAVATFVRITGAPESVALQKLEEYGGNLNEAVNAYFMQGDRHIQRQNLVAAPQDNYSDATSQNRVGSSGYLPFLSAARRFRPSLLLDPNYRRELRGIANGIGATPFTSPVRHAPPSVFNSAFEVPHHQSGLSSTNADRTGSLISHSRRVYGTDDYQNDNSLPQSNTSHVPDNETEEAMIQAAIEASKKESREGSSRKDFGALNGSSDGRLPQSHFQQEDDDLAHALSLSLKTAEQEEAIRKHLHEQKREGLGVDDLLARGEKTNSSGSLLEFRTSSNQNVAKDVAQPVISHPLNPSSSSHLHGNEDVFLSDKWDGISYDELNEAVFLESALFGESPTHSSHSISSLPDPQHHPEKAVDPKNRCLSSTTSQLSRDTQVLRQQQDADKQNELNSLKEAETHCPKEEESHKKLLERKELEKMLDKKEIRLSNEPPSHDENAITIVIRMPDGSRRERLFLQTDKLQLLFDFIDICGAVEPGTYRVVKSFPRRAYSTNDNSSTFNEVGLTSKNEALFLELI